MASLRRRPGDGHAKSKKGKAKSRKTKADRQGDDGLPESLWRVIESHRPSYLDNLPNSLLDVYDEFKGCGMFGNDRWKGGVYSLMVFAINGHKPYPRRASDSDRSKLSSIVTLMTNVEQEAVSSRKDVRVLLQIVEQARLQRTSVKDPFAWKFVHEYVESKYEAVNLRRSAQPEKRRVTSKSPDCTRSPKRGNTRQEVEQMMSKPYIPLEFYPANAPFVEETAFLYEPPQDVKELSPLPPPPPPPAIPQNLSDRWAYDGVDNRILRANFVGLPTIPEQHLSFLRITMQCDYIVVVCDGVLETDALTNPFVWTLEHIEAEFGAGNMYHKYRRSTRELANSQTFKEPDGYTYLLPKDYLRYLKLRQQADQADSADETRHKLTAFEFTCGCEECWNANGDLCPGHLIDDVRTVTLQMMNVELATSLHRFHEQFLRIFKLDQEILPGGDWCIMNAITPSSRPLTGPNLYISPAGGYTHINQDDHGSVDSEHLCLSGNHEVLILRRLPERHLANAVDILNNIVSGDYSLDEQATRKLKDMGYEPILCNLTAGQSVHINKGRWHVIRNSTRDVLPEDDSRNKLRNDIIKSLGNHADSICMSIAWKWNFVGADSAGINREVASMVAASQRCRQKEMKLLAPIGHAILQMGLYITNTHDLSGKPAGVDNDIVAFAPNERLSTVARGILPSLNWVALREVNSFERALAAANDRRTRSRQSRGHELVQARVPDIQRNPVNLTFDARGNDYFCRLCDAELPNCYFRCNGCESLRNDYIICIDCYVDGTYLNEQRRDAVSHRFHCGFLSGNVKGSCSKKCKSCNICKFGTCCSCRCHSDFTMHMRLATAAHVKQLVRDVATIAGDPIEHADATMIRLKYGADPGGSVYGELSQMVFDTDPVNSKNVSARESCVRGECGKKKYTGSKD
ncbi:hypothetical protein MPSEU_000895300 [Mayamaea pseudoterrestris]|nr:hypothetical protein MPSEU_000895300 [Mayamaea pseudoterrestris]